MAERFAPVGAEPAQKHGAAILSGLMPRSSEPSYKRPSLNILKRAAAARPGAEFSQGAMREQASMLEAVLGDFGIKGDIKAIKPGPVVTLFELEPAREALRHRATRWLARLRGFVARKQAPVESPEAFSQNEPDDQAVAEDKSKSPSKKNP